MTDILYLFNCYFLSFHLIFKTFSWVEASGLTDQNKLAGYDRILIILIYIFAVFALISIAGTQNTLGLIILVWITKMIRARRIFIQKTPLDLAFLLFFIACCISTVFSIKPLESFIHLKNVLLIFVVYMIASNVHEEHQAVLTADIMVFLSALLGILALLTTDLTGGQRVRALQGTTMTWGAMSTIFILITLSLFLFGKKNRKRWLYLAAFLVQLISLVFSYVRGSWMGFLAGLLVLAFIKSKKLLIGGLVLIVIVFLLAPAPIKHRILSVTDLSVNSTRVRLTQWTNAVKIFKDYPIVGLGWIDLNEIHRAYAPPGADLNDYAYRIGHFHNNLIMFLLYFGIIGFLAGIYMIFKLIQTEYRLYRSIPEDKPHLSAWVIGSFAAMTGFWVNGMFDWTFGDAEPVTLLWFTVGLSLAVSRIASDK